MTAEAKSGLCLTFQSLAVSLRTTRFNIKNSAWAHISLSLLYGSQNRQEMLRYATLKDWYL